jgi:hypothetical protein
VLLAFVSFRILCLPFFSTFTFHCLSADDHAPLVSRPSPSLFRAKQTTRKRKHPDCRLVICNDQSAILSLYFLLLLAGYMFLFVFFFPFV